MAISLNSIINNKTEKRISKTPAYLVVVMAICVIVVELFMMFSLYLSGYKHQGEHLYEMVTSRAKIIETVARSNLIDEQLNKKQKDKALETTLLQIKAAHSESKGFGKTGEFVMAHHAGNDIEFILDQRHQGKSNAYKKISLDSDMALPMRLALEGKSGIIEALDYRGEIVLAAYTPIEVHSWGLVAKMDLEEI